MLVPKGRGTCTCKRPLASEWYTEFDCEVGLSDQPVRWRYLRLSHVGGGRENEVCSNLWNRSDSDARADLHRHGNFRSEDEVPLMRTALAGWQGQLFSISFLGLGATYTMSTNTVPLVRSDLLFVI